MHAIDSRRILFVLGMHRCGTSALCAALESCGASFGTNLLDPMAEVNEEGFWEDADVVQLNQQLLEHVDATWFSPPQEVDAATWSSEALSDIRASALTILQRGFGDGALQAVKDPRLCITLPFWLQMCHQLQLPVSVCVISRAPLEVARSLQKRDGFPIGYGLRLYAQYRRLMAATLPGDAAFLTYDALLQDPASAMATLAALLPLGTPDKGFDTLVKPQLRHHDKLDGDPLLCEADDGQLDLDALDAAIARAYPGGQLLAQLALSMVQRGEKLTELGGQHSEVLATLQQRDVDVEELSALHREAVGTIGERDAQIVEFDRRLAETGEHLGKTLERLGEIDRVMATPGIGLLFRAMLKHERR